MANRVGAYMENRGVNFIREAIPTRLEKPNPDGKIIVHYK